MKEIIIKEDKEIGISDEELLKALEQAICEKKMQLKKVLLLPPDFTRMHSGAGKITNMYYNMLKKICQVDIMPALGTHEAMSKSEWEDFFGEYIPFSCMVVHNWRNDVVKIGEVPGDYVSFISEGLVEEAIDVEVNKRLLDKTYDLIISIGQVVPHEVVGMANYSKNIFVGCGGSSMINKSHMLGAFYGLERIMGKDGTPVRKVFDYAEQHFIKDIPLMYVLTVTTAKQGKVSIHGLYIGRERKLFEEAVKLSQEKNLTFVDRPFKKVIVYLDGKEFKSTWLGNKSVYRTRMAIADGGELIVLAPGVKKFGEDDKNDELIRKYGYVGREKVLELVKQNDDLQGNLSVAAHLIHGSSDDRFSITYAVEKLTKEEVEGVNYKYMPLKEAQKMYNPEKLKDGFNILENGEEIFYISNPALGLWADRSKFI
ncbi:lactate racemase domain-containing protein [Clostridium sp. SYSU_GA19001]|uniref:lactate racemase domain-containing protein n=1 Tax=Clostridium caldaquaticum TaxID=2940653 RepID=UPI002077506A|nr:lactate racemase domain-containing protein [Clostridium caldaquaticum]MCM8712008.1 lactate racemase domain-containing protein [Clostridium caldaquaticum]